ncbi:MAG: VCBS repeat-containing protein [Deltaproteobacteria bacterium]|nr:VCBS repeat-containing protein [Deltaproteobacteria bacterium]
MIRGFHIWLILVVTAGCGGGTDASDSGTPPADEGFHYAGESSPVDAGPGDAADSGLVEVGPGDVADSGPADTGPGDAGDSGLADTGPKDGGDSGADTEPECGDDPWGQLQTAAAWVSADYGYATGLGWADIDGDSDADLVVSYGNDMDPGKLVVYENDNGTFGPTPVWQSSQNYYYAFLAVGDVNGDGWVDVAVSVFIGSGSGIQLFMNDNGTLGSSPAWTQTGFNSLHCAFGDMDLDGDLDLAVTAGNPYGDSDYSRVYENDGTGSFGSQPAWTAETARATVDTVWADFDKNGWLDLVLANAGTGHTLYLNHDGVLDSSPVWSASGGGFSANSLDWGDIDNDGWLDIAVSENSQLGSGQYIRAWCGPDFEQCWQSQNTSNMSAVSLEDIDGDDDLDMAAGAWWGSVRLFMNHGGLETSPSWESNNNNIVVEDFGWEDVDGSHWCERTVTGERLVAVPGRGRVLSVENGVAGEGYVTGPGTIKATYLQARARDLAVSNWQPNDGNELYIRQ